MPARPQASDYFHAFRFHVIDPEGSSKLDPVAGFTSCTAPELTIEVSEYKEGIWSMKRKSPGIPTVNDITLSQGVVKGRTKFWDWIKDIQKGNDYRRHLMINVYHRDDVAGVSEYPNAEASMKIKLLEAFPIRCKAVGDMDANTSDVMISEMDIAYEDVELENPAA